MAPAAQAKVNAAAMRRMWGAIAQLGERYNGIVEVSGSIPLSSTILITKAKTRLKEQRRHQAPFSCNHPVIF